MINYDIPQHAKDYIHRVGRTARAGKAGKAISFVTQYDVENYQKIEHLLDKKLDIYKCEEEEVLIFNERVQEAQRIANQELKDMIESKTKKDTDYDDEDTNKKGNKALGKRKNDKKFPDKKFNNEKKLKKYIKFDI